MYNDAEQKKEKAVRRDLHVALAQGSAYEGIFSSFYTCCFKPTKVLAKKLFTIRIISCNF